MVISQEVDSVGKIKNVVLIIHLSGISDCQMEILNKQLNVSAWNLGKSLRLKIYVYSV